MRTAGGHDSTDVQNGIGTEAGTAEMPPAMPSGWPGVNGVAKTAGVMGAADPGGGIDQYPGADILGNDCCWGNHAIIPCAGAAGWRLNTDVAGVET